MIKRPLQVSHTFLAEVLDKEAIAVDATMGNGNDTAFWLACQKTFMLLIFKNKP